MTDLATPTIIKIKTAPDIVAAVPYFVGFHPQESLVVMSLRGPRKRSGVTIRVDLPAAADHAALAAELTTLMRHDRASAALLVCYTEAPDDDGVLPRRDLVDRQMTALRSAGMAVVDALLVRGGRWWCYDCTQGCCPREGTELPSTPQGAGARLAAEAVLQGEVVLADRAALEATVRGPQALRRVVLEELVDEEAHRFHAERLADGDAADQRTQRLLAELVARRGDGGGAVSDEEAIRVVVGLHSKRCRDEVATWVLDERSEVLEDVLAELCRSALDDLCAPVCTLLAIAAYARGKGSLANAAIDRALGADPDYRMARLLAESLARQVTPVYLRRLLRDVRRELAREETNGPAAGHGRGGGGAGQRAAGGRSGARAASSRRRRRRSA